MSASPRVFAMDNLRALAMLAGVVFHAALAYSPMLRPIWPLADAQGSALVDAVAWGLHLFRMPLFFVVAGYFAAMLLARRGMTGLFRHRVRRVLLPLLVGTPMVLGSLHGLTVHAVETVQHPSPLLAFLRDDLAGDVPFLPGWAHLWFLAYLMLFTVLLWVIATLEPVRLLRACMAAPAWTVPVLMPLLLAAPLASVGVPWPAPEFLLPSLWAMVYFGLYFALGFRLFHAPALLDALRGVAPILFVGAVVACAAMPWMADAVPAALPGRHLVHAALEACAGTWLVLCCLIAAKRWLDRSNAVLRWLADASYWVYLVHLPLLFAIQYRLLDVSMHWLAKFTIATLLTLAVSLASYEWLVRRTMLARWVGAMPDTAGSATRGVA